MTLTNTFLGKLMSINKLFYTSMYVWCKGHKFAMQMCVSKPGTCAKHVGVDNETMEE